MEINNEQVRHLASLIRVQLTDEEIQTLGEQLNGLVNEFNILQEVDTDATEPTGHIADLKTILRPDVTKDSIRVEDVLSNAPETVSEFIRVKRVIE